MTIQRQYSLPNCTLLLEGISTQVGALQAMQSEVRPIMEILIKAECRLPGQTVPLSGGKEFFESLVNAVHSYAQKFLSGIDRPVDRSGNGQSFISIEAAGGNRHRLQIDLADPNAQGILGAPSVDLTTLQLFDLVDAIDQFVADTQTLPFWALNLSPVPKRYVKPSQPLAQQAIPAAIGLTGLALASLACFTLPIPQVQKPENLKLGETPAATTPVSPAATPSPTTATAPGPTTDVSPSPTTSPSVAAEPDLAKLEATLNTAPEITDPETLERLSKQLNQQITDKLAGKTFGEELIYRVGVAKNGDILGYKPANEAATDRAKDTPLASLLYLPASGSTQTTEPIAQFKVTFPPKGNLAIAPWNAPQAVATVSPSSSSPSPSSSPVGDGTPPAEIVDGQQLKELQPKLYDQINDQWNDRQSPPSDGIFRVRVRADGTIVDYEPVDQVAKEYTQSTPLPKLGKPADPNADPTESLASFKVVFTTRNVLQINPWHGRAQ
jgi:Domain of unknown function (DUF4335)